MSKKLIVLLLLSVSLLCSCSRGGEFFSESTSADEAKSEAMSTTAVTTAVVDDVTAATETTTTSGEERAEMFLDDMFQALINKDEDTWRSHVCLYVEGENGFLYNVDFESYKIVDLSLEYLQGTIDGIYYECTIEINISKSNDDRFPVGKSVWKLAMSNGICIHFIPEFVDVSDLCFGFYSNNKFTQLGYMFSYSFDLFQTIDDIKNLPDIAQKESFASDMANFISMASPESDGFGNYDYSPERVDELINEYFGMQEYDWGEDFKAFKGDLWKRAQMKTQYSIINEQTDEYIDITYYADFIYLTPAKKMRYYFEQDGDKIRLTATELLVDYGYEPNWESL